MGADQNQKLKSNLCRLGFYCNFLAFQIGFTTTAFNRFVILFAHIGLYFAETILFFSGKSMKIWFLRFNIYFLVVAALFMGCKSDSAEKSEKKKNKKEMATIHLHVEVNPDGTDHTQTVTVYRANPMLVAMWSQPFLDESSLKEASVIEDQGGYSIRLQFEYPRGARLLEMATSEYKGQRIVVVSAFPEMRCLAAPIITRRITDGIFEFTPDASREETERIVRGLNNMVKKMAKDK